MLENYDFIQEEDLELARNSRYGHIFKFLESVEKLLLEEVFDDSLLDREQLESMVEQKLDITPSSIEPIVNYLFAHGDQITVKDVIQKKYTLLYRAIKAEKMSNY